jgi:hypothetical protein
MGLMKSEEKKRFFLRSLKGTRPSYQPVNQWLCGSKIGSGTLSFMQ